MVSSRKNDKTCTRFLNFVLGKRFKNDKDGDSEKAVLHNDKTDIYLH
jgi:hypothetical protein